MLPIFSLIMIPAPLLKEKSEIVACWCLGGAGVWRETRVVRDLPFRLFGVMSLLPWSSYPWLNLFLVFDWATWFVRVPCLEVPSSRSASFSFESSYPYPIVCFFFLLTSYLGWWRNSAPTFFLSCFSRTSWKFLHLSVYITFNVALNRIGKILLTFWLFLVLTGLSSAECSSTGSRSALSIFFIFLAP